MDFNVEVRKKQLESLDQYISSSKDKLESILDCLGWKTDKLLEDDTRTLCPINSAHRIHIDHAEKHIEKCCIKSEGYDLNEKFLSEPTDGKTGQSIKIDQYSKIQILSGARFENPYLHTAWNGQDPDPKTSDRIFSTFSPDERLVLYEYCRANTIGPKTPAEFNIFAEEKNEHQTLSDLELKEMERNLKRRQVKYKSVHTNHKTHTEIMKEVIEQQMLLYEEWIMNKKSTKLDINGKQAANSKPCSSDIVETDQCSNDLDCSSSFTSKHSNGSRAVEYESNQQSQVDNLKNTRMDDSLSTISKYSGSSSRTNGRRYKEYQDYYENSNGHSSTNDYKYTRMDRSPSAVSKYSESSSKSNGRKKHKDHHEYYDKNSNGHSRSKRRYNEDQYSHRDSKQYKYSRSPNSRHSSSDRKSTNYHDSRNKRRKRKSRSKERSRSECKSSEKHLEAKCDPHNSSLGNEESNYHSKKSDSKQREGKLSSKRHRDKSYDDYENNSSRPHHRSRDDRTKMYKR